MRGKIVNSIVAGMNFLFGLLILFYKFFMPEASRATSQEASVMNGIYQYIPNENILKALKKGN